MASAVSVCREPLAGPYETLTYIEYPYVDEPKQNHPDESQLGQAELV